jgi:hypothetical protein
VAGRDITEGRATRAIAVDVGVVATTSIWQNTDVAYDVAIGGMPFIYSINDARPYIRQTAPFKKEQFDNQTEPGEQSLTGWWIRSQQSFHGGDGITFYDPANTTSNSPDHYRFADSKGVNVWDQGKVTLLNNVNVAHITTGAVRTNGRPNQFIRSIKWNNTSGVLLADEYDVDKIDNDGNETHFVNYNAGTDAAVYAICDDGTFAYWITNTATKKTVYKKPLTGTSASTADVTLMFDEVGLISNATMEYVKERIVMCADNKVYEFAPNATAMPTTVYTHPSTTHVYTSVAASGPAIYVSGYNGIQSSIIKFTLSTAGVMPTLTSAITAAELPVGEVVHKIHYYLGYMMIGTNKGIRVATVNDNDGSLSYGPLIVETSQPCYDFASRDHYVWCATGVAGEPGVIRIDLSTEVSPLRFAYANDVYYAGITGRVTTGCAFANGTDQLVFCSTGLTVGGTITNKAMTSGIATLTTASAHNLASGDKVWVEGVDSNFNSSTGAWTVTSATTTTFTYTSAVTATVSSTAVSSATALANTPGSTYIEDATDLMPSGYLTTGFIRFNTLEPKNFKRLIARGNYEYGSMTLETVIADGTEYNVVTYDAAVPPVEVTTSTPQEAQEYLAYKFLLERDVDDITRGPVMEGYQAKATIATPRQRVMRFPVYCYDVETDRYNVQVGYEGRAFDRIAQLESVEENGDVLTWQDLTTGESRQVVIEQVSFTRLTPPDRGFTGYGGVIDITIRTV